MAALVVSSGAGFERVVDLWAKPELDGVEAGGAGLAKPKLDVVEAARAGFRDCLVVGAIEKDDVV